MNAQTRGYGETVRGEYDALMSLATRLRELSERKYDPSQPRWPAGRSDGGQWRRFLYGVRRLARATELDIATWFERNQEAVSRTLGAVQAVYGGAEIAGGFLAVGVGGASAPSGVGVGAAALGAWMIVHGHDNFDAGWKALVTGRPHDTNLRRALLGMGLTDAQASATELLLGGFTPGTAARAGRSAVEKAARRNLERRAMYDLNPIVLPVSVRGGSIWDEPDILERGLAWESFDRARTGFRATKPNQRVIDQISPDGRIVVSNKTIDVTGLSYSAAERRGLYHTMKRQIAALADFKAGSGSVAEFALVKEKRLHVLLPAAETLPGQALQIAAAQSYAEQRGIKLIVEYAR